MRERDRLSNLRNKMRSLQRDVLRTDIFLSAMMSVNLLTYPSGYTLPSNSRQVVIKLMPNLYKTFRGMCRLDEPHDKIKRNVLKLQMCVCIFDLSNGIKK